MYECDSGQGEHSCECAESVPASVCPGSASGNECESPDENEPVGSDACPSARVCVHVCVCEWTDVSSVSRSRSAAPPAPAFPSRAPGTREASAAQAPT